MNENRGGHAGVRTDVLDRVREGVVQFDGRGRCTYLNERAEELLDARGELGVDVTALFPDDAVSVIREQIGADRTEDDPEQFDAVAGTRRIRGRVYADDDGSSVHFDVSRDADAASGSDGNDRDDSEWRAELLNRMDGLAWGGDGAAFGDPVRLLSTLVERTSEAIFIKDADGVYRFVNRAASEVFGISPEELVGTTDRELFEPPAVADIRATDEKVLTSGESHQSETERVIDGDKRVFATEKHPLTDETGAVIGVLGLSRDITERKRRERELQRREYLFERVQDIANIGFWEWDPDIDVVTFSRGVARLHGFDGPFETDKEGAIDFYHPEDRPAVETAVEQAVETGEWPDFERRLVRPSGEVRDVRVRGEVITDEEGDTELIRGVSQDITTQKERERELERKNERLDEFASVISHDLRNPLSVARGYATLLADEYDEQAVDGITTALDRMESIVEDTLKLARQGERVAQSEPVELEPLCNRCWNMVETADAEMVIEETGTIRGDPQRLQQVFENLFGNAIDHGGGDVTVRVGITDEETLYVADDGPGVAPDDREEVFEPGYSSTDDGTGFGLAIVRRIAEAHGWSVRLTDSASGGARFEFSDVTVDD